MKKDDPLAAAVSRIAPNELEKENQVLKAENARLRELLAWIGPRIRRRNGNGQESSDFCVLDILGQPMYRRQPCRHHDIWNEAARAEN